MVNIKRILLLRSIYFSQSFFSKIAVFIKAKSNSFRAYLNLIAKAPCEPFKIYCISRRYEEIIPNYIVLRENVLKAVSLAIVMSMILRCAIVASSKGNVVSLSWLVYHHWPRRFNKAAGFRLDLSGHAQWSFHAPFPSPHRSPPAYLPLSLSPFHSPSISGRRARNKFRSYFYFVQERIPPPRSRRGSSERTKFRSN